MITMMMESAPEHIMAIYAKKMDLNIPQKKREKDFYSYIYTSAISWRFPRNHNIIETEQIK